MNYHNPVLPGFYPDPSICKYQDTYYMVNSTFQYFPGVTLFESKDLINWNQIGYVLTRESQLGLDKAGKSGGIYAPTIRCHNGRFYMVTTNVSTIGNFYVWTDDIHGEWSEPILVEQGGIDPSLYFEDGKCYFMSNGMDENGKSAIIQCEIDIETGKKLSEGRCIWNGAGGRYLEGPHLYKIHNEYYLLAAEGGTEYGHMEICAKSKNLYGPFEGDPHNPILTNRNLGGYLIQGCGHADLVEDQNGNWWMVHLAYRQIGQWRMFHTIGRETYLIPVSFDKDGWIIAGDHGTTRLEIETDRIDEAVIQKQQKLYTFENTTPGVEWCYLRNPILGNYTLTKDSYQLTAGKDSLHDPLGVPTFIGIRQTGMEGSLSCELTVSSQEAGISVYMDDEHHYDLAVQKTEAGYLLLKRVCVGDISYIQESYSIAHSAAKNEEESLTVTLLIHFDPLSYHFEMVSQGVTYDLGTNQSKYLSTEVAEGFTGVLFALYAQSIDAQSNIPAVFEHFTCKYAK